jgi:hypothetical protein
MPRPRPDAIITIEFYPGKTETLYEPGLRAVDPERIAGHLRALADQIENPDVSEAVRFLKARHAPSIITLETITADPERKPPFPFDSDRLIQPIRGGMKYPARPTDV